MHTAEKFLFSNTKSHNPYFNRWFSAIKEKEEEGYANFEGHNPYFNRWFSAII